MDNATHSLFGLLLAEALIRRQERCGRVYSPAMVSVLRWASVLANNVNDLDATYAQRLGGKLGYLLHHRGHTHTLIATPLLGLVVFAACLAFCHFSKRGCARWRSLLLLCLLGPCVHIGLDSMNNYGVHPWWPVQSRWYYADTLFIIEPWLWVTLVPALAFGLASRAARIALWSVLGLGLGLAWSLEMVPWVVALLLSLGAGLGVWLTRAASADFRIQYAAGAVAVTLCAFGLGARAAEAQVRAEHAGHAATEEQLLDVVITPAPGNPLCFSVVSASVAGSDARYIARAGSVSLLPTLLSPEACRIQPTGLTVGLQPAPRAAAQGIRWEGQWSAQLNDLLRLQREHCQVAAWLRFARIPFWQREQSAAGVALADTEILLGDLRFDRDPDLDFDEFVVTEPAPTCPDWVPPWVPPRQDLLEFTRPAR